MKKFICFYAVFNMALLLVMPSSFANDRSEALSDVKEMLPLVCGDFSAEGHSSKFSIQGDAQAKLKGLLGKLADLGVSGASNFDSEEYVGVLRSEVGQQLKSVQGCRLKVFEDMKQLVIGKDPSTIASGGNTTSQQNSSQVNSGNNNVLIQGNGNSVSKP